MPLRTTHRTEAPPSGPAPGKGDPGGATQILLVTFIMIGVWSLLLAAGFGKKWSRREFRAYLLLAKVVVVLGAAIFLGVYFLIKKMVVPHLG